MKIFVLTSRFPYPLEKGDKLRIFHQIKHLSKDHEVVLCSLSEKTVQASWLAALEPYCQSIHIFPVSKFGLPIAGIRSLLNGWPFQVGYFYRSHLKRKIHALIALEQPDHLYCQLIRCAPYVWDLEVPKTLDYMDAFSLGAKRWARESSFLAQAFWGQEYRRLKKFEELAFNGFDHHAIISKQDQDALSISAKEQIAIIPNGVDVEYFQPQEARETKYDVVFVGNLGYRPNLAAVRSIAHDILPKLLLIRPNIKILIAGARPGKEILSLQGDHLHIGGWYEDIREAYSSAAILIAPLFTGSGQQNKILEAMALGLPCITTSIVNNAINAVPEKDLWIADSPEEFARKIDFLLGQPKKMEATSKNALKFVRDNYSWRNFVEQLESLFKS